jgi:hypothetical protein
MEDRMPVDSAAAETDWMKVCADCGEGCNAEAIAELAMITVEPKSWWLNFFAHHVARGIDGEKLSLAVRNFRAAQQQLVAAIAAETPKE